MVAKRYQLSIPVQRLPPGWAQPGTRTVAAAILGCRRAGAASPAETGVPCHNLYAPFANFRQEAISNYGRVSFLCIGRAETLFYLCRRYVSEF
jgi:hypothetical protein